MQNPTEHAWRHGFTRRRVLAGAGKVGVAALGSQLVTTRYAFAAAPKSAVPKAVTLNTLVVVFLRGGMDGLSALVPAFEPDLYTARPHTAVPASLLLPADRGFGLHPALAPLLPHWRSGRMAAVHAVGSPDLSRSHFQAQECIERGGTGMVSGWLDRLLGALGPGTTFRGVAAGAGLPASLYGTADALAMTGLDGFLLNEAARTRERAMTALRCLYTGVDHPRAGAALRTLDALGAAGRLGAAAPKSTVSYPAGEFGRSMKDVARLIRANAGLRVATVDVGGWDMHTSLGKADSGQMATHLADLAGTLSAFCTDLGPALDGVTLVAMTEFGRRVAENGNGGADHGHGGVMFLLGGGLAGGRVHGRWPGLAPADLDHGDVAGVNDYRDVLAELIRVRLGVGDTSAVFPGYPPRVLGICG
jgi:uncharacterized protein (DUF1501 family)